MSDNNKIIIMFSIAIISVVVSMFCWAEIISKYECFENRITKLEQSQCAVKDAKVHADIKFEACMKQLRKIP